MKLTMFVAAALLTGTVTATAHHSFSAEFDSTKQVTLDGVVVMMEGADPVTVPEELAFWHAQGLRCLSLAHFGRSRYAAGTPSLAAARGPGERIQISRA